MGLFGNIRNSINSAADAAARQVNKLNRENSKLKSEKNNLNFKYNRAASDNTKLRSEYNKLNEKATLIQGQLIESNNKAKVVASDRFGELKSQYLKKIELVDTQEELLTKQNTSIREYAKLITDNNTLLTNNDASASKHAREVLYNSKDLAFYNTISNVLKFILLAISIAIIYLLLKK
tara:strand:- start:1442 stop:1975 length:534 start_codon:yes stop_codon:yes gene_type:complete